MHSAASVPSAASDSAAAPPNTKGRDPIARGLSVSVPLD
jgi:hypothetical protein